MSKTLVVIGAGPGISGAVAKKFASNGFSVGLVARTPAKLAEQAKAIEAAGAKVATASADASDPASVKKAIQEIRAKLGPITVIHYNAATPKAGDLLTASAEELRGVLDTGVTGLVAAVQEALPDLKQSKGAVLITNGGFGMSVDAVDEICVKANSMGLGIANAAKHKTTRVLSRALEPQDVFVGEVMVLGIVKGTAWDDGSSKLEASAVGEKFWSLYQGRKEPYAQIG